MKQAPLQFLLLLMLSCGLTCWSCADPGSGIRIRDWVLSPHASPYVSYLSNVLLEEEGEEDDLLWGTHLGMSANYRMPQASFAGSVWGRSERYDAFSSLDHTDYGDTVAGSYQWPAGTQVSVRQAFSSEQVVDYAADERVDLDRHLAGVEIRRALGPYLHGGAGYEFKEKTYAGNEFNDWNQHLAVLSVRCRLSEATDAYTVGKAGSLDAEGFNDSATYYHVVTGVSSDRTAKLTARAGVGVLGLSSHGTDVNELCVDGIIEWEVTHSVSIELQAERYAQPSASDLDNYSVVTALKADMSWSVLECLAVTLLGTYEQWESAHPVRISATSAQKRDDRVMGVELDVAYQAPLNWLRVFARGGYAQQDSSLQGRDYSTTGVSAGLRLSY